jgi:phosphoribosylaminoimidazole-succinocarboxamide synthase
VSTALEIPGFKHIYSGKVRDLYENQNQELLVVASDRISAFDWVLPTLIPDKGKILTKLSLWWFEQLSEIVDNHIISVSVPEIVKDRAMIVKKLTMLPIEAVVRGYLTGSGLIEYKEKQSVGGNSLPAGLKEADKLPTTIFTPATKAEIGLHDENIDYEKCVSIIGSADAQTLRNKSIDIYMRASQIAEKQGIILADTKFEFGKQSGSEELILGDEVLTPDSSRFWPQDKWQPGIIQNSFDKQYVRDWLTSQASGWNKNSESAPPELPSEVVAKTRQRYVEAYEKITGNKF